MHINPMLFYFILFITLLHSIPLHSQSWTASEKLVTASSYCAFLNDKAFSDPFFFYNEKMSSDSESGCIIRKGAAGNYHYCVIAGRENIPITYTSFTPLSLGIEGTASKNCDSFLLLENDFSEATAIHSLKSNNIFLFFLSFQQPNLSMIPSAASLAESWSWDQIAAEMIEFFCLSYCFGKARKPECSEKRCPKCGACLEDSSTKVEQTKNINEASHLIRQKSPSYDSLNEK